jgi:hypothetical protein
LPSCMTTSARKTCLFSFFSSDITYWTQKQCLRLWYWRNWIHSTNSLIFYGSESSGWTLSWW